jgi:hypothetical protein
MYSVLVLLDMEVPDDHMSDSLLVYDLNELALHELLEADCE